MSHTISTLLLALVLANPPAGRPAEVEVRLTDQSTMKLALKDEHIEVDTRYGKLTVPVAEVRRIEFATRIPDEVQKRIDTAVADLGSPQFKRRETAGSDLLALREKAYPALLKAAKHGDAEVARRAEELSAHLRESIPEDQLEFRSHDVVYTTDMTLTGRIAASAWHVDTVPFGEQSLKLSDVRSLRALGLPEPDSAAEPRNVLADPGNLLTLHGQIGKTFFIRVTGAANAGLWGTDVYTSDSSLAAAAVHAGVLALGQTGVVRVTIVLPPPQFGGSTRNGVTSANFNAFPGAFKVSK